VQIQFTSDVRQHNGLHLKTRYTGPDPTIFELVA